MFFSEMPQRGHGLPTDRPLGGEGQGCRVTVWPCQTLTLLVPPDDEINVGWMEAREADTAKVTSAMGNESARILGSSARLGRRGWGNLQKERNLQ